MDNNETLILKNRLFQQQIFKTLRRGLDKHSIDLPARVCEINLLHIHTHTQSLFQGAKPGVTAFFRMTVGGLQYVMTNSDNHNLPVVVIEVNDGLLETTSASGKALGS